jgi:P-type Na+/K+ transporter
MALGFQTADPDVMKRPPHNQKWGIFTAEVLIDLTVYGLWAGALSLATFAIIVFGFGNGDLGIDCNNAYSEQCDTVFRARGATWVVLVWASLFLAWEVVHLRRSFFRMRNKYPIYTQWLHDTYGKNRFLFWCVVVGFFLVFPLLYIPVINDVVFLHVGISWEWAICFVSILVVLFTTYTLADKTPSFHQIAILLFGLGVEAWKWAKRVYIRHYRRTREADEEDGADDEIPANYSRNIQRPAPVLSRA